MSLVYTMYFVLLHYAKLEEKQYMLVWEGGGADVLHQCGCCDLVPQSGPKYFSQEAPTIFQVSDKTNFT